MLSRHTQGLKSFYSGWIKQQFEMDLPYDGKPEAAMVKPAFEGDALGILGMSAGGSVAIGYMVTPLLLSFLSLQPLSSLVSASAGCAVG